MEFKIGEDIEDENKESELKKDNGKITTIIIIVVAIIIGILVFLFLNGMLNPKKTTKTNTQVPTSEKRSLSESNVKTLYQYVTYGANTDIRNDKYVKSEKVTLDDFTEEEKYYYALMFVQVEDYDFTGNYDENNNKIYTISDRTIKKYMQRYFGSNVKYSTDVKLKYPFTFSINDMNVGNIKYNEETSSFDTVFEKEELKEEDTIIDPYLGKLVEAYKDVDGGYRLIEKIIFVDVKKQDNDKYDVVISKDYDHKTIISSLTDQSIEDVKKITIDKYIDKASTITYTFKMNNRSELCFYSSEIK